MKKLLFSILFLTIFLSFLASCIIAVADYSGRGILPPRYEFHRNLTLAPGGTVSLENTNGDIEIHGWNKDEVEIYAEEVKSRPDYATIRFYRLGASEPKIRLDKFEGFIKIKSPGAGGSDETSTFDYTLNVPHSVNLKDVLNNRGNILISDIYGKVEIDLVEGDLNIENFSGSLESSIKTGTIQAEVLDLRTEDEVRITTQQGDITLYLQPDVNASLEASARNGEISSDFDLKQPMPAQKISAQLGAKGALISLSTLDGNIQIKKVQETKK
jgi:hypothetical protein